MRCYCRGHRYQHGPVSIAIDASLLQFYLFGILTSRFCRSDGKFANHAVLMTGFGTGEDMMLQEMEYVRFALFTRHPPFSLSLSHFR